jgi:hypothetical protein
MKKQIHLKSLFHLETNYQNNQFIVIITKDIYIWLINFVNSYVSDIILFI